MNKLPENLALQPGVAVVSANIVRMAILGAASHRSRSYALTQKRSYWPTLDRDRTWIYGQCVIAHRREP